MSTSLVPLTQRAITTRASQISLVPSADTFARSYSTRRGGANRIYGTFIEDSRSVDDSQSDETGRSDGEYVSGWPWSYSVGGTAIAHYLFYAANPAGWSGRLINLYA
ncbi:MAG: hypothetical protein WAN65_26875 [Candidatus Sulfotelmatobacter sp.]